MAFMSDKEKVAYYMGLLGAIKRTKLYLFVIDLNEVMKDFFIEEHDIEILRIEVASHSFFDNEIELTLMTEIDAIKGYTLKGDEAINTLQDLCSYMTSRTS